MKTLTFILVLFACLAGLSFLGQLNDGYVLIYLPNLSEITLSFNLFILLSLVAMGLLYALIRLIRHTLRIPHRYRQMKHNRLIKKHETLLQKALLAHYEGRHQICIDTITAMKQAHASTHPMYGVVQLILASSYAYAGDLVTARTIFQELSQTHPDHAQAVDMVAAKVYYLLERHTDSLQAAESALAREPKLNHALRFSLLAKHALGQTHDSLPLINTLKASGVLSDQDASRFTAASIKQQLTQIQGEANLQAWQTTLNQEERSDPEIVHALCERYMQAGAFASAAALAAPFVLQTPAYCAFFAPILFRLLPYIQIDARQSLETIAQTTLRNTSSTQSPDHADLSMLLARLALLRGDYDQSLAYDLTHDMDHAPQSHLLRYHAYVAQRAFADAEHNQTQVFHALARYYHSHTEPDVIQS